MISPNTLVSIVVPAYKAAHYIGDTLNSVSCQIHRNWELIVVEDGCNDGTEEIVAEFRRRHVDNKVTFHRHEKNSGPSQARNTAIALASGDLISLLDSDDLWMPDHLSDSLRGLESSGADICYSTAMMFDDESGKDLYKWGPTPEELQTFPSSLFARSYIVPSTVVLKRDVFARVGSFDLDPRLQGCEDVDFWLKCVESQVSFHHIDGNHCRYRKGHSIALTTRMDRIFLRHCYVLEKHIAMRTIPMDLKKKALAEYYNFAATYNQATLPMSATQLYLRSWLLQPRKLSRLVSAAKMLPLVLSAMVRSHSIDATQ